MSLGYKFKTAEKLIKGLDPGERTVFRRLCHDIRRAEAELLEQGQGLMTYCREGCGGLCCRNVNPDDLITQLDVTFMVGGRSGCGRPSG